ncbi:hypothetical protein ACH4NF_34615 [Streptomyces sp. NPDC017248]|uniref:hypothetical protein n=1 Tax=unclassified Streptomyces TaxID=2593676 RepID=UPI00379D5866
MRRFGITALLASACLSAAALAASSTTAAAQADTAQCNQTYPPAPGVSGTMHQCTWDDGRIRVFGTMHDTALIDGATLLTVQIGTYTSKWLICASDTPVDTDYQTGGAVYWTHRAVSADNC